MERYCDLCGDLGEVTDEDRWASFSCGTWVCDGCILSEARKINSPKGIAVDWLKENHYDAYFFGLGFIQIKIDDSNRVHIYSPELPAFVESPHDHRYNFVSKVLRGRLVNKVWEEFIDIKLTPGTENWREPNSTIEIDYVSCQQSGEALQVPESYESTVDYVDSFEINEGSSYYISRNTFHTVAPDFSVGPCVTWVTRGAVNKEFARVLRFPDDKKECPFSQEIEKDELWKIVERALA